MLKTNMPYISELGDTLDESWFVKDKIIFENMSSIIDNFIDYDESSINYSTLRQEFKNEKVINIEYENESHLISLSKFLSNYVNRDVYFIPASFHLTEVDEMRQEFYPYLMAKGLLSTETLQKSLNSLISIYTGEYFILQENHDFLMLIKNGEAIIIYY